MKIVRLYIILQSNPVSYIMGLKEISFKWRSFTKLEAVVWKNSPSFFSFHCLTFEITIIERSEGEFYYLLFI